MSNIRFLAALITLLAATGCATNAQYRVNFDSIPQGATLVCSGTNYGYTPVTLYYDESVKSQSYINVSSCSAVWSSGISLAYPAYLTVYPQGGTNTTLRRPQGPGYTQDAEFALKVEQQKVQQQNAASASQQSRTQQTVSCRKFGDLSGKVYQFAYGYCPVGYY